MRSSSPSYSKPTKKKRSVRALLLLAAVAVIGTAVGIIIGYFSHPSSSVADGPCLGRTVPDKIIGDATPDITEHIISLMRADSISRFHRYAAPIRRPACLHPRSGHFLRSGSNLSRFVQIYSSDYLRISVSDKKLTQRVLNSCSIYFHIGSAIGSTHGYAHTH